MITSKLRFFLSISFNNHVGATNPKSLPNSSKYNISNQYLSPRKINIHLIKVRNSSSSTEAIKEFNETRTLTYENGSKGEPLFSTNEYERRLSTLRTKMKEQNLDVAIFTSMHNVGYFSNFFYCAFGRPYAQVVTPERSVTISSMVDAGQPWRTSVSENLVYTDWKKDNYLTALKEAIGPSGLKGNIGVEFDTLNLQMVQRFQTTFNKTDFADIAPAAMKMRMVKSSEEHELYRKTARIADMGGFAVREAIREGVTEHQVAMQGTQAMVTEIAKTFGAKTEIRDTWVWLQSGEQNTDGAHNPLTTR